MNELHFGRKLEELPELDRQFVTYVDDHLPRLDDEDSRELENLPESTYRLHDLMPPVSAGYVKFGTVLEVDDGGVSKLPGLTRYIEFMVDAPNDTVLTTLTIYWTSYPEFHVFDVCDAEGRSLGADPEFIAASLNSLQELEEAGETTHFS